MSLAKPLPSPLRHPGRAAGTALCLLALGALPAVGDGFRWEPGRRAPAVVGTKSVTHEKKTDASSSRATLEGRVVEDTQESSQLDVRVEREVLAVTEKGLVAKERLRFERFELVVGKEPPDTSLEGRLVSVDRTGPTVKRELAAKAGAPEPQASALEWLDGWLAKPEGQAVLLGALFPAAGVEADGEWAIDVEKVATVLLGSKAALKAGGSPGSGRLTKVRIEDGVRLGHVSLSVELGLRSIPGTGDAFTEGGILKLTVEGDLALEAEKSPRKKLVVTTALEGRSVQDEGKLVLDVKLSSSVSVEVK